MIKVIFLDIDGVLNSEEWIISQGDKFDLPENQINPNAVIILNKIIEATDAKLVISSTWRYPFLSHPIEKIKNMISSYNIKGEVIGMTPVRMDGSRSNEIRSWLQQNKEKLKVSKYVAIDDEYIDLPSIRTSFKNGLQNKHLSKAIKILNS